MFRDRCRSLFHAAVFELHVEGDDTVLHLILDDYDPKLSRVGRIPGYGL
jgi:hypothetical protein